MINQSDSAEIQLAEMKKQKKVFIASPYTKPDPAVNINTCVKVFNRLLDDGRCVPVNMLWTHFYHCINPRGYENWLAYCMIFLQQCDAMLVLPGDSSGKDREIEIAKSLDIPVFYSVEELYTWLRFCDLEEMGNVIDNDETV